jgi:uncharacterized membrane protein
MKTEKKGLRRITNTVIFTALVFVATYIIQIPIAATTGYFNVGDSMIYVAALLYGPFVGAFAGGVGAALSDAIGYGIFVPGTLVIKFVEGAIVGYVGHKIRPKAGTIAMWRATSILFAVGLGASTYFIGINYMKVFGNALDQLLWIIVALFLGIMIVSLSLLAEAQISWRSFAIVLGGSEMVVGYFLYESLLSFLFPGLGIFALSEIPVNIGQMLVGMTIALPAVKTVQRALPTEQA